MNNGLDTSIANHIQVNRGITLIMLATVGFGLNPLFARWAYSGGLTAETALCYRFIFPALFLFPFVFKRGYDPRAAVKAVMLGMFVGLGTITYFRSIAQAPVATAALIYFTHPLFTILLMGIFFREPFTGKSILVAGLVVAACGLILSPGSLSEGQIWALGMSFLMPLSFATLMIGFEQWLHILPLWPRTALTLWGQVIIIVPVLLLVPFDTIMPLTDFGWIGVVGLATVSSLLPQVLMAAGIPLTGATRASVLGTAELLTSLLVGWVVLSEPVQWPELLGAGLIFIAIYVSRPAKYVEL
jgi:drug/metabolite transporter (DMT)-like permease